MGISFMLESTDDIKNLDISDDKRFFSATHEEILSGATSDVYFLRAKKILKHLGLDDTPVVTEVFCRKSGIFCGGEEVRRLLAGREVEFYSLPDGARFEKGATLMQIIGPYGNFGIYETALLGMAASSTAWATAASECKEAGGDSQVICFGARHIHPAVAPAMERAAMIGGVDGCSCVIGALLAGAMPTGTIPHAAIIIAGDTVAISKAFDKYVDESVPRIILVDTFKDEAEESLRVAEALKDKLAGVRLDTPSERGGVSPQLVDEVRKRLDLAGFNKVKIVVSGGLHPDRIRELKLYGAEVFGVGSYISCAAPIDMTMDIKEVNGKPIAKRGRIPGRSNTDNLKRVL